MFREDIPDEDVLRALSVVQAEDLLERLPRGLATEITEGGENLSMGERRLQQALDRLMSGRTTIVIAHRLQTVLAADRILLVDGGRVADSGTHAELLHRNKLYGELCRLQLQASCKPTKAAAQPAGARP